MRPTFTLYNIAQKKPIPELLRKSHNLLSACQTPYAVMGDSLTLFSKTCEEMPGLGRETRFAALCFCCILWKRRTAV
jgi:hypothetical protein